MESEDTHAIARNRYYGLPMQFSDLVRPEGIIANLAADTREAALRAMATRLVDERYCKASFVEAILARERAHPSGLPMAGHKIAIPHTDAEHVERSTILFARLNRPVEFRSMGDPDEKLEIQMISMFALKEKPRIGDLLETLLSVYQHNEVLDRLLHAPDAREMFITLQRAVVEYGK